MSETKIREYFSKETEEYLIGSFKKANLNEQDVNSLFDWLAKAPRWTTIRVNTIICQDVQSAINSIQTFVDKVSIA
jgi:hypothetical protein